MFVFFILSPPPPDFSRDRSAATTAPATIAKQAHLQPCPLLCLSSPRLFLRLFLRPALPFPLASDFQSLRSFLHPPTHISNQRSIQGSAQDGYKPCVGMDPFRQVGAVGTQFRRLRGYRPPTRARPPAPLSSFLDTHCWCLSREADTTSIIVGRCCQVDWEENDVARHPRVGGGGD